MNPQQKAFLEHIGMLIPKLFDAIRLGNVKSEYVLGDRVIGKRQVRLKLVAEVVDPGSNPLATHSQMRQVHATDPRSNKTSDSVTNNPASASASTSTNTTLAPRRGPRRKHPMSR